MNAALDDAAEAYLQRLLSEAPPLTTEQAALIVRVFTPTTQTPATA